MSLKHDLAKHILDHHEELEAWFAQQSKFAPTPFYCSVDLRDSGHKIVPVDSNLFPAGFNNICPADQRTAPEHFKKSLGGIRRLAILPEDHTRNTFYLENLQALQTILNEAGVDARIVREWKREDTSRGPRIVTQNAEGPGEWIPDALLLNNDYSNGIPDALQPEGWSPDQQWLTPIELGWHARKKSTHFQHYNALAREFSDLIGLDSWHVTLATEAESPVDFSTGEGVESVAQKVDAMLAKLRTEHAAHGDTREPYVYIKNDAGTYGMGIMTAHSAEEVRAMNRRTKNKMSVGKGSVPIRSVCIQEGIPSTTRVDQSTVAEPVIYLARCQLIGGFLRSNPERDEESNLNSPGMVFKKLCMTDLNDRLEHEELELDPIVKGHLLELVYGSIARLSALAAGRELAAVKPQRSQ